MKRTLGYLVLVTWCGCLTAAFPSPDPRLNRTRRSVHCREDLEYPSGDLCCLNCPAGSFLTSPCSRASEQGRCQKCSLGTFTAHDNGLNQCFTCAQCRSDQEMVRSCSTTHDTQCQCKPGGFCSPDQACEVCRKCSRCGKDEEVVRNCTPISNTECKTIPADSGQTSDTWTGLVVTLALVVILLVIVLSACLYRHKRKATDSASSQSELKSGFNDAQKSNGQSARCWTLVRPKSLPLDPEEQRQLCESAGSACNSEADLIQPPFCVSSTAPVPETCAPAAALYAPVLTLQNSSRADEARFNVVAVKGEDSLRLCFEFFEELDVHYHSRFFRHLGLSDNLIKSKVSLAYDDRVHELLNLWLEKRGREANLKDLLKALMDLNQRRTAENIVERAVEAGHYYYE